MNAELYTDRETEPNDLKNKNLEDKLVKSITLPEYVLVTSEGVLVRATGGRQTKTEFLKWIRG